MPPTFGFALRAWNQLSRTMLAIFWPPEEGAVDPLAPKPATSAAVRREA